MRYSVFLLVSGYMNLCMRKMYVQLQVCVVICDLVCVSAQHVRSTLALTAGRPKVAFS